MNKLTKLFLGFLILFLILIIALIFSDQPENAIGATDVTYKTMKKSGDTMASMPTTKWLSYFFGLGIVGIFYFVLFMGGRKQQPDLRQKMYTAIGVGCIFNLLVYSLMVFSWWDYTQTNSMDYFMGLPKPSAWMFFGLMFIPLIVTYFYITKFSDWVITPEEEKQFSEIVRKRKLRETTK